MGAILYVLVAVIAVVVTLLIAVPITQKKLLWKTRSVRMRKKWAQQRKRQETL